MDLLFERLDKLDVECIDRFASWFSHHVSNLDFKWDWEHWEWALQHGESRQVLFLREVIDRLVRMSYIERISKTLPEDFRSLLPPRPTPIFVYDQGSFHLC